MKRERSGGGSKMDIAYLLLCVLMVSVHSLDVEIGINVDKTKETSHSHEHLDFRYREHPELNPCKNMKCDEGEKCHVVRNPVMLQLPIALCEKEVLDGTDDGCPKFPLVSNIFQCKTEIEWEGLARKQCQIRLAATVETVITSVRYPCRFGRRSSGVQVFQQVEVSCCPELSSSGTLQPTATDQVVTSVSPTKESVTEEMKTDAPTNWDEWGETSDWDYADFSGNEVGSDDGCANFRLESNIFQCKTEIEWEGLARKNCQIHLEATAETVFTSVRYPCHFGRQSSGVRVFQQVEVSCCPELSSSGTLPPTPATDAVVTSVSPTKEAMTTPGNTAPTTWDEWEKTIDWDYADFSGTDMKDSLWPVPAEDEDQSPSQAPPTTMPPPKYTETSPTPKVSDITPPQNNPVGAITEDVPAQDPPRNHHHLMWFIFPSVAIATLCSMACLTFCLVRACMVRRRLRRAYKRFPADPPQRVLANSSYNDTEEEDELYSKPNTGVGGYEPAVKPNLIFRNDSTEDMLAYDMFIAGKQQ